MQLENFSELSKVAAHPAFRDENAGLQASRSLQITHVIHGTFLLMFFDLTQILRLQHTLRPSSRIQPVQAQLY
jgi:hypothetical protein